MTKLKTLKDLIEPSTGKGYSTTDTIRKIQLQFAGGLKQEAVKWIKELELGDKREKVLKLGEYTFYEDKWEARELFAIQEWIKHFLNITKEDLK